MSAGLGRLFDAWQAVLSRVRIESIRGRILALAVLAALIPALLTSSLSYVQNRAALTEKIGQELVTTGSQAGREADVWLKERLYDLRVFASSYVVSDALGRAGSAGRVADYLQSVRGRFSDYEELQLVDVQGRLVASSMRGARALQLPDAWTRKIETSGSLVGEPHWDERARKRLLVLGVPVLRVDGRPLGALFARTNLTGLAKILSPYASRTSLQVYLAAADGRLVVDARGGPAPERAPQLSSGALRRLTEAAGGVVQYAGLDGVETVGSARALPRGSWLAVADLPVAQAYDQVNRLRNLTLLVVAGLLLVVGLLAYWLGALIARPLLRLTGAAAKVKGGDLSVGLPAGGSGEVGYLTQVFNDMVESLRQHRGELERLSNTDSLTGLANRRHLMNVIETEIARAKRTRRPISVLMLDVDHFKKYNDQHGHLAGDEVLRRIGTILRESTRVYDCPARYGGEEFLAVLSETSTQDALTVAGRIRERVRKEPFAGGVVTVSIGVAEFQVHGDTAYALIEQADGALYAAKRAGRDRVVVASKGEKKG